MTELIRDAERIKKIVPSRYVTDEVGLPTLNDILSELSKPGRDPRDSFETFSFTAGVETIEDLQPGMRLPGIVTNVTAFGAFVDIGVHRDGMVHISELSDRFVKDPREVVHVHQQVTVTVLELDYERKRIALSMKTVAKPSRGDAKSDAAQASAKSGENKPRKKAPGKKSSEKKSGTAREARSEAFNNPFAGLNEIFKKK